MKTQLAAVAVVLMVAGSALALSTAQAAPTCNPVDHVSDSCNVPFADGGHVNIVSSVPSRNLSFEAKCITRTDAECAGDRHADAQFIGATFIPWSAFGLASPFCVSWTQLAQWPEHYGEGGQPPVCVGVPTSSAPPTTAPPTATSTPKSTPTDTATSTLTPSSTPTPPVTPIPSYTATETPAPTKTPSATPSFILGTPIAVDSPSCEVACTELARTGSDLPLDVILGFAGLAIAFGGILVALGGIRQTRRHRLLEAEHIENVEHLFDDGRPE